METYSTPTPGTIKQAFPEFSAFKLDPKLLEIAHHMGFTHATAIQQQCIPKIQAGQDVVGQSGTGSGKTVAFALPLLEKITPRAGIQAVILTPTRELCVQVADVLALFGKSLHINVTTVYGGVGIGPQIAHLQTADVVVATPGRMIDHMQRRTIRFDRVRFLVLDEADKMFEMGFFEPVERIIKAIPPNRQTMLFSATMDENVKNLMRRYLKSPVIVKAEMQVDAKLLTQGYYVVQKNDKVSLLVHLLNNKMHGLTIVFCGMRHEVDKVAKILRKQGVEATAIHGGISQNKRERALNSLRNEDSLVLVATDVAARGLDIKNVSHIYNFSMPKTHDDYIHRIGRTARAGSKGDAITFMNPGEEHEFLRMLRQKGFHAQRHEMPAFERIVFPAHDAPMHDSRSHDPRRPQRHSSEHPSQQRQSFGNQCRSPSHQTDRHAPSSHFHSGPREHAARPDYQGSQDRAAHQSSSEHPHRQHQDGRESRPDASGRPGQRSFSNFHKKRKQFPRR